jgi:hypothetical protein
MYNKTYHSMTQFLTATLLPEKSEMSEVSRYVSITSNWDFTLKVADFNCLVRGLLHDGLPVLMSIPEEKDTKGHPVTRREAIEGEESYSFTQTQRRRGQFTSRPGRFTPIERDAPDCLH